MEAMALRFLFLFLLCFRFASSGDAEALLSLKSTVDPSNILRWTGSNYCRWQGVKECVNGKVTKLVIEFHNLNGTLQENSLNKLDQLRVLSLKGNLITGQIPDLSGLKNLKSLFLNSNRFSGKFPASISGLHRLKIIVLSENLISGQIPASLVKLRRLYVFLVQNNRLTGTIPTLNQTSLKFFDVSNNRLTGKIPATKALLQFNFSSFQNNPDLCGDQLLKPCNIVLPPAPSPVSIEIQTGSSKRRIKNWVIAAIAVGSFLGFLAICVGVWVVFSRRSHVRPGDRETRAGSKRALEQQAGSESELNTVKSGFQWDQTGLGTLTFCGGAEQIYCLEDLLKASAETLGRGTIGSTYKAVMETGFIVTVKRLKNSSSPGLDEFQRHMEMLGHLRHPNLVPLRAYFQAKEERLLVYDYFPNGSLHSLIHGTRPSGGKPLHWTSCLKIAEDLATALVYLHQTPGLIHGNLKSSNVLLGSDFESCLTDYGLLPFRTDSVEEPPLLFYRAPESRNPRKSFTHKSDVYSFGVLLLELLTGKILSHDPVRDSGKDIPTWVRSVREQEMESGEDPSSGNEVSDEKLVALVNVAMACVSAEPDGRPAMREVLRMVQEGRTEAQVSSNSSDHSPGRWSDTVQSLPRESGSEHLNFTERD